MKTACYWNKQTPTQLYHVLPSSSKYTFSPVYCDQKDRCMMTSCKHPLYLHLHTYTDVIHLKSSLPSS